MTAGQVTINFSSAKRGWRFDSGREPRWRNGHVVESVDAPAQVYRTTGRSFSRATSEAFPARTLEPLWRLDDTQNLPMLFLPVTRGFELARAQAAVVPRGEDPSRTNFWPDVLLAQYGARAPSAARAPPSILSL
jgi:hypothetical protein